MDPASDSTFANDKPKSRQRQGSACVECRRRKLRCDGEQPNCGSCSDFGLACVPTSFTTPRGPKKGHMRALQNRLATLEARLQEQQDAAATSTTIFDMPPNEDSFMQSNGQLPTPPISLDLSTEIDMLQMLDYSLDPNIPELVRADLDQIYFERAHSFAPILQRRRYFTWARQPMKTESQKCLQYAMWALAAALSSQFEHFRAPLRVAADRILGELESRDTSPDLIEIEHAQALVLLLIHDFLKASFQKGWLGAAKCFRLLQFMRLYDVDSPQNGAKRLADPHGEDKIRTEEMRRTFWVAYSIDRFVNLKSDRPLTLQESVISVRLPVPDEQFQAGQCPARNFLSEAITSANHQEICPFSESIIMATICGRAMSHRQRAAVENVYSRVASQFWERHFWLEEILTTRSQAIRLHDPGNMMGDSLLLFTKMASQSLMLYLCQDMESRAWSTPDDNNAVLQVKNRSREAAREMVNLSESLVHLSHFKVHPFTPLLLVLCADFLKNRHDDLGSDEIDAEKIVQLLSDMSSMNNLASDGLKESVLPFPAPCIS